MKLTDWLIPTFLLPLALTASAQENSFPYKLTKKDLFAIPVSAVAYYGSKELSDQKDHNLTVNQITKLDRNDVNRFDRNATYHWNRSMDKTSNVLYKTLPYLPVALVVPELVQKRWNHAVTLGVMYMEVFWLTTGVTDISKSLTGRIRPYLYNTSFTPEERFQFQNTEAPTASTSFISGHSSRTFAFAVFTSKTFTDIYGKGAASILVWSTTLTAASLTAYARVAAGEHYPTDVLAGALVGGAIGYFIPVLHKNTPDNLTVSVMPGYFHLAYRF